MLRKFLLHAIPFVLPFALYALWVVLSRRRAVPGEAKAPLWQDAPWIWLIGAGLALVVVSFVSLALFTGHEPGGTYVPPRYEGGKVLPAEIR